MTEKVRAGDESDIAYLQAEIARLCAELDLHMGAYLKVVMAIGDGSLSPDRAIMEIENLRAELAAAQVACYVLREVAPILYDSSDLRAIALCPDVESALRGLDSTLTQKTQSDCLAAAEAGAGEMQSWIMEFVPEMIANDVVRNIILGAISVVDIHAVARAALAERDPTPDSVG